MPSARLPAMKSPSATRSSGTEPRTGRRKKKPTRRGSAAPGYSRSQYRATILAIITSSGRTGMASRFSIVPRSRSLVIDSVVMNRVDNSQHDADQPRHDIEHGQLLGIVAGVNDELERRRLRLALRGSAAGRVCRSAPSEPSAAVALPIAVGSVASASTRTDGDSPRSTARSKSGGISMTNRSSPSARPASASASQSSGANVVIAGVLQRGDEGALIFRMIDSKAGRSADFSDRR